MDFNTSVAPPSPAALELRPPAPGPSPLEIAAGVQQIRARQQEIQAQRQQMQTQQLQQQELQLNLAQRKAVNEAYMGAFTPQSDGTVQLDKDKLANALVTAGHGEAIPGILDSWTKHQQSLAALQETNQKVAAGEAEAAGTLAATVQAANNDPALFHTLATDAINRKIIPASHYAPIDQAVSQALQQDPTGEAARALVGKFTEQMIAGSPKQQELANARTTSQAAASRAASAATEAANNTASTNAKLPGEKAESDIKAAHANALKTMTDADWLKAIDGTVEDKNSPLYRRLVNQVAFYRGQGDLDKADASIKSAADQLGSTEKAVATAKATAPIKIDVAAGEQRARNSLSQLTPEALDMAAEGYRKTGQMPNLGMGNAQLRAQIINRAGEMGPLDLASEQAAYAANKASLTALTKNTDSVQAFENTAGKNLDLFLQQAEKIVDSGSPLINRPLRSISKSMLGSADQAAYETARQVAVNEIAKVTGNPGLSGQLSDSARKEVSNFNPNDATLAQTFRVAQVLKQDMANRMQSYGEQISDIRKRIGGGQSGGSASVPALPAKLSQSDVGKIFLSQKTGERLKITAVNPNDPSQFQSQVVK